jgi:hypothetical protein
MLVNDASQMVTKDEQEAPGESIKVHLPVERLKLAHKNHEERFLCGFGLAERAFIWALEMLLHTVDGQTRCVIDMMRKST